MKKKIMLIGLALIIASVFVGVLIFKRLFYYNYYLDIPLSGRTVISSDWSEIDVGDLVKLKKDNQFVSLVLESPLEPDSRNGGIKTPDGKIFNPEIKLIDEELNEYLLEYCGGRRYEAKVMANYGCNSKLSSAKKYPKLIIRSSYPMTVREIIWSGYNTKDLP